VIRGTGKVMGVARCRRLQVEEGGQVSGRMEMLSDSAAPASRPAMPLAASDVDQLT
jgi:cytoskeletal protein CcmA (bactofilin family)